MEEYAASFADEAAASRLVDTLAESVPPRIVVSTVLRQWYTMYHPGSGAVRIENAEALEEAFGADLRAQYAGLGRLALSGALAKLRKVVLAGLQVCRTWLEKYGQQEGASAPGRGGRGRGRGVKRSAAAVEQSGGLRQGGLGGKV